MEPNDRTANFQRGLGDGLSLAIEFVAVPLIFAVVGFGLDRWFGTGPLLAVVLGAVGFVGVLLRTYYAYLARMEYEEEGKPWTRSRR
ncbi:MAG TPA: AtpZ/AtpI family protein [Acidimicrobiia bacterium]